MSNFTVAIPDDLLSQAKIVAAKRNTSVNALIRLLLEGLVNSEALVFSGNYEILLRYSLGQVSAKEALKDLHLDDEVHLHELLMNTGLPAPRVALDQEDAMQKRFLAMIDKAHP